MTPNDAELNERVLRLKQERKAVILAHNYQIAEVQDIADFVGDSLELSQSAAKTDAEVIVFCGVHFMAETASILCPDKKVLLPDKNAGCPMANMITGEELRRKKAEMPGAAVVCYVNSLAEVKAESDICCTSANAVKIVQSLDSDDILFIPDQYLGHWVASKTNRKLTLWPGFCPTHVKIRPEDIMAVKKEHPAAKVVVHPECRPEVTAIADEVMGTGGMCRFARQTEATELIIGTEIGILHRLSKENPGKKFFPASKRAVCPNMKLITLEKVLWALEDMATEVKVPEAIRLNAKAAVDKMLEVGMGQPPDMSRRVAL
ncbi:MAG: quinolinate synthase NadA [Chloroflexi bacterium]|nr:quinolinate synthase NadA [Chloroflexota bacterium]